MKLLTHFYDDHLISLNIESYDFFRLEKNNNIFTTHVRSP